MFLILRHPAMLPDMGFIKLPVGLGFWASIVPLPEHVVVRVVNHAANEKKAKDDKKVKWRAKELGQGLDDEVEEEEEGDDSPIKWEELGGADKDLSLPQVGPSPWHVLG